MTTDLPSIPAGTNLIAVLLDLIASADPVVKCVMGLLIVASVLCWTVILEKTIRLSRFGAQVRGFERFIAASDAAPSEKTWFARKLFAAAHDLRWSPGESRSEIEARLEKVMRLAARQQLIRLQARLRFLATVGSTAPFIGLFGTVWGIMNSFSLQLPASKIRAWRSSPPELRRLCSPRRLVSRLPFPQSLPTIRSPARFPAKRSGSTLPLPSWLSPTPSVLVVEDRKQWG